MIENAGQHADTVFHEMLDNTVNLDFPLKDYFQDVHTKTQHCLHHTASGKGVNGDYQHFLKPGHIATPIIIGHEKIHKLFNSKYWGYHLGIPKKQFKKIGIPYQRLDKVSIGTEIDNWGPLKLIDGNFTTYINEWGEGSRIDRKGNQLKVFVPESKVVHYPNKFRRYEFYQAYNDFQIRATKWTCQYYHYRYGIPMDYREEIWDVDTNALEGIAGTYTHNSYRPDKSDVHPQPELIEMLKSLT